VPRRFPLRTIVLMVLTLLTFGWYYWQTHDARRHAQPPPPHAQQVEVVPMGGDH
jgi:hypothetical protein